MWHMEQIITLAILAIANHVIVFGFIQLYKLKKVRRIYNLEADQSQLKEELNNSWLTSPLHSLLIGGALYSGFLVSTTETWWNFLYTFVIVFVWTEIWHYFSHRLMHHKS